MVALRLCSTRGAVKRWTLHFGMHAVHEKIWYMQIVRESLEQNTVSAMRSIQDAKRSAPAVGLFPRVGANRGLNDNR